MEVVELVLCVQETRSNRLRVTHRTVILNVIRNQVNRIQNGHSAVSTAALGSLYTIEIAWTIMVLFYGANRNEF